MTQSESWPPILPSFCFIDYVYEPNPQKRLRVKSRRDAVREAALRAIGVCDSDRLPHAGFDGRAWAVMYEDLDNVKCWSFFSKGEISWPAKK